MRRFLRVWAAGYLGPRRFTNGLKDAPAPGWGFHAVILRSMMDSLLIYLPVAVMGRQPPTPSYLTFLAADHYYFTLIWLTPLIFLTQWLLGGAVLHLVLRLRRLPGDIDRILNLTGMAGLVVATVLVLWDWFWFMAGAANQVFLGVSHLVIDLWWFVLVVAGLRQIVGGSTRLAIVAHL
ncbi:MAG: hypothetical protein R6W76_13595 [Caldilinea sp.]